jgi:hypothetical protein
MRYLGTEQALADYAELIEEIKQGYNASQSPVIGGWVGGRMNTWYLIGVHSLQVVHQR